MWIAPENQLILNVMISPLHIISLLVTHPSIIKPTSTDPCTTTESSWEYSCITFQYYAARRPTFLPLALNTLGGSVVLQTHYKSVVLPALDLLMMRTLKRPIWSKCFLTVPGSMWIISSAPRGIHHHAINVGPVHNIGHKHSPAMEPGLCCSVFLTSADSMWSTSSASGGRS